MPSRRTLVLTPSSPTLCQGFGSDTGSSCSSEVRQPHRIRFEFENVQLSRAGTWQRLQRRLCRPPSQVEGRRRAPHRFGSSVTTTAAAPARRSLVRAFWRGVGRPARRDDRSRWGRVPAAAADRPVWLHCPASVVVNRAMSLLVVITALPALLVSGAMVDGLSALASRPQSARRQRDRSLGPARSSGPSASTAAFDSPLFDPFTSMSPGDIHTCRHSTLGHQPDDVPLTWSIKARKILETGNLLSSVSPPASRMPPIWSMGRVMICWPTNPNNAANANSCP